MKSRQEEHGRKGSFHGALTTIELGESKAPIGVLEQASQKCTPQLEVKSRRVGGGQLSSTVEVRPGRGISWASAG